MPIDQVTKAGDTPQGAIPVTIEYENGNKSDGVYTPALSFVPLATRLAWFVIRKGEQDILLPEKFDFDTVTKQYGKKPTTRLIVRSLVRGENGVFVADLTFKSMLTDEIMQCLREHDRRTQALCRAQGIKEAAVLKNAWRMFSVSIVSGGPKEVGSEVKNKIVQPVIADAPPVFMGSALYAEHFDAEAIKEFEAAWVVTEAQAVDETARQDIAVTPPDTDYPEDF